MKKTKLIYGAGLLAMLAFTACSEDEPATGGENATISGNAYVAVRIIDASTIGGRGTDGGYQDAIAGEHEVSSADFYFYDENGLFVSHANVWDDKANANPVNDNVQFNSTTVVVLKDLKAKNYPKYVVTVLNQPSGFTVADGSTMEDMEAALSNASYSNGIKNEDGKFVMASTSFAGTCAYYFATELIEDNFTLTNPTTETLVPAQIYVERLAAKVSLNFGTGAGVTDNHNGTYTKKMTITVAGDLNEDDDTDPALIGAEELYVQLLGWRLNATAKNTHMVKTIDTTWDATNLPGFPGWNKAADHRSYWGKSFNYDAANAVYPTGDNGRNGTDANTYEWDATWTPCGATGFPLKYVSFDSIYSRNLNTPLYCAENTNTSDIISAENSGSAITSVLIKARVTRDAAGEDNLNLVLYRGVMYTQEHYFKYMLNRMNAAENLNFYTCVDEDAEDKEYTQITGDLLKLVPKGDGSVGIEHNFGTTPIYKFDAGNNKFVAIDATDKTTLNTNLAALNAGDGYKAIAYTGGTMYYNIPIQHLGSNEGAAVGKVNEAVYGIVRNHSYVITINKIANLGHGVFEPDKKIITPDPTPDQKLWNVGATINILSWKIVNQGVDL